MFCTGSVSATIRASKEAAGGTTLPITRPGREHDTVAYRTDINGLRAVTRVGPTANDVITTDIVHLSDAGSIFLVEAMGKNLFPRP
jgi:hypothetical protein